MVMRIIAVRPQESVDVDRQVFRLQQEVPDQVHIIRTRSTGDVRVFSIPDTPLFQLQDNFLQDAVNHFFFTFLGRSLLYFNRQTFFFGLARLVQPHSEHGFDSSEYSIW